MDENEIAKLTKAYEKAAALRSAAAELFAHLNVEADRLELALVEARGETDRATLLRLRLDPDATEAQKHAAYVRVQARNVLGCPSAIGVLPVSERAEISAEVERLKAEQAGATP